MKQTVQLTKQFLSLKDNKTYPMFKNFAFIILASLFFSSCIKNTVSERSCDYDACAVKAPESEVQAVQAYLTSNGIEGTTKHCSGLFYRIENPGTGKTAEVCDGIYINYKGTLINGTVFDQRLDTENPIGFQLGSLIPGWINGIPLIKEGGRIHLYIPPSLGYGNRDNNGIPGGSILIFEIDLRQVVR
jgi:FKBP-type peptidyl-prolyl cis-trans isomerase FkpA